MNRGGCAPSLFTSLIGLGDGLMSECVCVCGRGRWVTLKHNGTALELIQQLLVSQDHTMMPVVPLASPLSGTTVSVHKFEWEQGSPACGLSWVCRWPLNTPANFSSLVHVATGGATGGSSALQRAAVGSPNCPARVGGGGVLCICQKHGTIRLKHKNWLAMQEEDIGLWEYTQPPTNTQLNVLHYDYTSLGWIFMDNKKELQHKIYYAHSGLRVTTNASDRNYFTMCWDEWLSKQTDFQSVW